MIDNTPKSEFSSGEYRPLGIPINELTAGLRVDSYLSTNFPFCSRASWQKRITKGQLLVDGETVKVSYRLLQGQRLSLYHPQVAEPEVDKDIFPLWKRGAVMAVYKPGNLPMHENGAYRFNTFSTLVKQQLGPEWAAVHRLDRETSGIVLCGATAEVRGLLSQSLAKRVLAKEYLAIAKGLSQEKSWVEDGPIGDLDTSEIRIKKWVVDGGQVASTSFSVLEEKAGYSKLKVLPKTGRTNQIRIHAAFGGLPLVGDILYHPDEAVFLNWFAHGKTADVVAQAGFKRCLLHATALRFIHPEDEKPCDIVCPMPSDMDDFWQNLSNSDD